MSPRAWADPEGCSSTIVLYDPREGGKVFMNTNLGWVGPVDLDLEKDETAEQAAEKIAEGYELEEVPEERARWLAGMEEPNAESEA